MKHIKYSGVGAESTYRRGIQEWGHGCKQYPEIVLHRVFAKLASDNPVRTVFVLVLKPAVEKEVSSGVPR